MFWSEEMTRNALALRDRANERPTMRQISVEEAKKEVHPIEWLAEYERKADARQATWEASPFASAVRRLVRWSPA